MNKSNLLVELKNIKTYFFLDEGTVRAVDGVSFNIEKGETLGVVGESGCGKSVTAQSIMRIVPFPGKIIEGEILFRQKRNGGKETVIDLARLDAQGEVARSIRGKEISMIFQEPMTSFSPVHTIGAQIIEAIVLHHEGITQREARRLGIEMLDKTGIPNPSQRIDEYPFQLSGGLRQRAMVSMALSCNPILLIADEPTTALDVTIQAQILELMRSLQEEFKMSIMYITHNLGVIAETAKDVVVMYLGRGVESAPVDTIFHNSMHPYTASLLKSIPAVGKKAKERLYPIKGSIPSPFEIPEGCSFYPRCPHFKKGVCDKDVPPLIEVEKGHKVRCFLYV